MEFKKGIVLSSQNDVVVFVFKWRGEHRHREIPAKLQSSSCTLGQKYLHNRKRIHRIL